MGVELGAWVTEQVRGRRGSLLFLFFSFFLDTFSSFKNAWSSKLRSEKGKLLSADTPYAIKEGSAGVSNF